MSARGPSDIVAEAGSLVDESGGLGPFVRQFGVGGVLYALVLQSIELITSAGTVLLAPFRALGEGLADLVGGTIGTGVDVIAAGGAQSIESITEGLAQFAGPLAFPLAVAVVMLSVFVFIRAVANLEFSPLVFVRSR